MAQFDVAVLGASLDGLTAAAVLAQSGLKVVLLERSEMLGAAFREEEIKAGFRLPILRHDIETYPASLAAELGLSRFGVSFSEAAGLLTFTPEGIVATPSDPEAARMALAEISRRDAEALGAFFAEQERFARRLRQGLRKPPPHPFGAEQGLASAMKDEGGPAFLKAMMQSAEAYLERWFEQDRIRAHITCDALALTGLGQDDPGTALFIAQKAATGGLMGRGVRVSGGPAALIEGLAAAIRARGGEIRTGQDVLSVHLAGSRVKGVALTSGRGVDTRAVISSLDIRRTLLSLIDSGRLPAPVIAGIRAYQARGTLAKVNLALDGLPDFRGLPKSLLSGAITIAPPFSELGAAARAGSGGEMNQRPWLDIRIPSLADPGRAPEGKHVMSIIMHGTPISPVGGAWTADRRDELLARTLQALEGCAPGVTQRVMAANVVTAHDIDAEERMPGGDLMGGALTPSQLWWNRPLAALAAYETPIHGLFVCGETSHPGPLLPGQSGANAARRLLARAGRREA